MIHHVYANRSNVGDWLSARGIQTLLAPEDIVEHLCDQRFFDETLERLATAHPSDLVVIGGGGLFMNYFRPFWEGLLQIDAPPFCVWGAGVCDLKRQSSTLPGDLLEELVEESLLFVVRDDLTAELLAGRQGMCVVPCPALGALAPASPAGRALLHASHKFTVGADAYDAVNATLASFARQTGRDLREVNNRIPESSETAYRAVLGEYARADLVVSSRLHGCIIALAMGRQVLAVSGDRKVEAFMRAAGLEDWVVDVDDLRSLSQRLEALPAQRPPLQFIERTLRANQSIARRIRALARGDVPRPRAGDAAAMGASGTFAVRGRLTDSGGSR